MSTLEENKALARRFLKLVSEHDVDGLCQMVASTWTMHGGPPALPQGPAGIRTLFGTFGKIEQEWIVEDVLADGDKVVVRAINRCTQDSFFGVPGRGRTQVFTAMFMHHIRDGKIVETWRNADDLGRVLALGGRIDPGA